MGRLDFGLQGEPGSVMRGRDAGTAGPCTVPPCTVPICSIHREAHRRLGRGVSRRHDADGLRLAARSAARSARRDCRLRNRWAALDTTYYQA